MNERILARIDFQNDFAAPEGALSINNPELIARHQRFADNLQKGMFSEIWDFRDTHFAETYAQTKEAESFPLHTEFGSWGWEAAAALKDNIPVCTFFKSTTNLWNEVNQYAALQQDLRGKNVYLCGLLSDICVQQGMDGFLRRGAKVTVLEDLCQGMNKQIPEIVSEPKYQKFVEEGLLRHITSAQFFRSILLEKKLNYNLVNVRGGK
ncbi:MAG: cysteine hydrolase family protein [Alphaproteobacteria bacterium]|nr:cysteine hydrolase family protein [Alphaproteobacteria bacterium]